MSSHNIRFQVCTARELQPFQSELLEFEKEFLYPLNENENFYISHGKNYAAFFERMGESRYLIAFDQNQVIGMISVVKKKIFFGGKYYSFFYLADLKIRKSYRGQELSHQLYWKLVKAIPTHRYAWKWSFCYFVGMIGEKGDVSHSFRNSVPTKLVRSLGYLKIYFVKLEKLALIKKSFVTKESPSSTVLNLSSLSNNAHSSSEYMSLRGVKDLILESTTQPISICHLNLHDLSDAQVWEQLTTIGQTNLQESYEQCCFAIDECRINLIHQLERNHIIAKSHAHVLGFSLFPHLMRYSFLTLNTDEI